MGVRKGRNAVASAGGVRACTMEEESERHGCDEATVNFAASTGPKHANRLGAIEFAPLHVKELQMQ